MYIYKCIYIHIYTGVELVAELSDFVHEDMHKYFPNLENKVKITLIEGSDKVLGAFDPHMGTYAMCTLLDRGNTVYIYIYIYIYICAFSLLYVSSYKI
jgi:NADH dehydrogenase FAD-containing subunit